MYFLNLIGLVYFFAFASLFLQAKGLYGPKGILPIGEYLNFVKRIFPKYTYLKTPTLFWISSSNAMIVSVCGIGVLLSALLTAGIWPPVILLLLWFLYLSIVVVGQDFMSYQWDMFLLEVGLMAFFYSLQTPPDPWMLWAFWALLARFMISTGLVKILSGDETWRSLTALKYHYETQPIPNPIAFFMHHLPSGFHKASAAAMFFVELAVPFLILGPEPLRYVAFALFVSLQVVLIVTGNFAFLNILTLVLCVPLLETPSSNLWPPNPIGIFYIALNVLHLVRLLRPRQWVLKLLHPFFRLYVTGAYGLFAVMTTSRQELIIQGSEDGLDWKTYEFRHKPGEIHKRPPFIAPFHPRLDWQMWFAALRPNAFEIWKTNLYQRLLEGSPEVLKLLKTNPFPNKPPRFLRVALYDYHFASLKTWRKTGQWWERSLMGIYPQMEIRKDH